MMVESEHSPLIMIENVTKTYRAKGSAPEYIALNNVTLAIEEGDFVAITGPSGSGKSTLLNVIGCLDAPTVGTVSIAGRNTSTMTDAEVSRLRWNEMGYVFQNFELIHRLSVADNVSMPFWFGGKEDHHAVVELLSQLGIAPKAQKLSDELSGGEKQRVAIARALANSPRIVLADEPTGNLDSVTGANVVRILKDINERKRVTVVVVTHDETVAAVANTRIVMKDGRVDGIARKETAR